MLGGERMKQTRVEEELRGVALLVQEGKLAPEEAQDIRKYLEDMDQEAAEI